MLQPAHIRPLLEAALLVALAFVLSQIVLFKLPSGGSITPGASILLCLVAIRHGLKLGILAGLNYGMLSLFFGGVFVSLISVVLDYFLAYALLGLASLWRQHPVRAILISQGLRFLCHVSSGFLILGGLDSPWTAVYGSLIYNLSYLVPDVILGLILFWPVIHSPKFRAQPELS